MLPRSEEPHRTKEIPSSSVQNRYDSFTEDVLMIRHVDLNRNVGDCTDCHGFINLAMSGVLPPDFVYSTQTTRLWSAWKTTRKKIEAVLTFCDGNTIFRRIYEAVIVDA